MCVVQIHVRWQGSVCDISLGHPIENCVVSWLLSNAVLFMFVATTPIHQGENNSELCWKVENVRKCTEKTCNYTWRYRNWSWAPSGTGLEPYLMDYNDGADAPQIGMGSWRHINQCVKIGSFSVGMASYAVELSSKTIYSTKLPQNWWRKHFKLRDWGVLNTRNNSLSNDKKLCAGTQGGHANRRFHYPERWEVWFSCGLSRRSPYSGNVGGQIPRIFQRFIPVSLYVARLFAQLGVKKIAGPITISANIWSIINSSMSSS